MDFQKRRVQFLMFIAGVIALSIAGTLIYTCVCLCDLGVVGDGNACFWPPILFAEETTAIRQEI